MEGPSFYCSYLGFSPLSKPPTNIGVLQSTIRDLYFKYRKTPVSGRSANLKLTQQGVVVVLIEDGVVTAELFFEFSSVTFVDAVKFSAVKSSSEKKPKAMFVPLDESKGVASDKNAFLVEKSFHFLVSSSHPPLVVCVVRRPQGVKALDCHVFALDTIENSLHIAALIGSTQMPAAGPMMRGDGGGDVVRGIAVGGGGGGGGGFDRGTRGDVIRTEHGEYSVYRGPASYDQPPQQRFSGGPPPGPGRNGHMGPPPGGVMGPPPGGVPGPIVLTQDNFREPMSPNQPPYGGAPGPGGYGMYENSNFSGLQGGAYQRQPDVVMHTRQRSADSGENVVLDRSFTGSEHSAGGVRMRYDEVNMRNNSNRSSGGPVSGDRLSGGPASANRLSGGQIPGSRLSASHIPPGGNISPRPQDLPPSQGLLVNQQYHSATSPVSPMGGIHSPRSPPVFSPTSPRGFDGRDGGPVFSASNLESRRNVDEEPQDEPNVANKPIAKVPPHMKAGIKVLPSDFRMVKLKPKADKRQDSAEESGYDNHKEIVEKYRELQETERDMGFGYDSRPMSNTKGGNYPDGNDFRDFSDMNKRRPEDKDRSIDFMSQWNESVKEYRSSGTREHNLRQVENNNKNRNSGPMEDRRNWRAGNQSNSSYDVGGANGTKEQEIASMFTNFNLQGGGSGQDVFRQARDRNEIEDGLGYLP